MGGTSNQLAPNTRGNNKRIGRAGSRQSLVSVGAAGSESKPFKHADEFASLPPFDPYRENKTGDDAFTQMAKYRQSRGGQQSALFARQQQQAAKHNNRGAAQSVAAKKATQKPQPETAQKPRTDQA